MSKALCFKIDLVEAWLFSKQITNHYSSNFVEIHA